ncbi:MAG: substrate-binding domain-containing protein [Kiloniellales bacterium]|nr:substrate-binding domain-containing protein [Kiloniellales bacterium]
MLRKVIAFGLAMAGLLAGSTTPALAAEVSISGSTTVSSAVVDPNAEAIEQQSGQLLRISAVGSGRGLLALVSGSAEIAMISAPLEAVIKKLEKKGNGRIDGSQFTVHELGNAQVAFVVSKKNPVKKLSFQQLVDIMAGKITNWKQVGGADLAIEIFAESSGGGVRTMVEKELKKDGTELVNANDAITTAVVVRRVKRSPGGLGIVARHQANDSVRIIETDRAIKQPLFLVTRGETKESVAKVVAAIRAVAKGL